MPRSSLQNHGARYARVPCPANARLLFAFRGNALPSELARCAVKLVYESNLIQTNAPLKTLQSSPPTTIKHSLGQRPKTGGRTRARECPDRHELSKTIEIGGPSWPVFGCLRLAGGVNHRPNSDVGFQVADRYSLAGGGWRGKKVASRADSGSKRASAIAAGRPAIFEAFRRFAVKFQQYSLDQDRVWRGRFRGRNKFSISAPARLAVGARINFFRATASRRKKTGEGPRKAGKSLMRFTTIPNLEIEGSFGNEANKNRLLPSVAKSILPGAPVNDLAHSFWGPAKRARLGIE